MKSLQENKFKEFFVQMWERITRHFLTCNIERCYFGLLVEDDDGPTLSVTFKGEENYHKDYIYIYYCPFCGRKVKTDTFEFEKEIKMTFTAQPKKQYVIEQIKLSYKRDVNGNPGSYVLYHEFDTSELSKILKTIRGIEGNIGIYDRNVWFTVSPLYDAGEVIKELESKLVLEPISDVFYEGGQDD